jgi:hypothetical protein
MPVAVLGHLPKVAEPRTIGYRVRRIHSSEEAR